MKTPKLLWDWGTAYDLFISLGALYQPEEFGLRGSWAAGVRARIPARERKTLEQSQWLGKAPMHWIHRLPDPKDGLTALWALRQLPAAARLATLALGPDPAATPEAVETLESVAARGSWNQQDLEVLTVGYQPDCKTRKGSRRHEEKLARILDLWSHAEEFGERYLEALGAYHQVFFAEDEERIRPALQAALARGRELARRLSLPELLEELSKGLRFEDVPDIAEVVLTPSYWSTHLVTFGKVGPGREMWLFGARPPNASLVPGQVVPDALLETLKALADPTRLRILRYLSEEPASAAELARRVRLRLPTVAHHLDILRRAGLVQRTIDMGTDRATKHYGARPQAIASICDSLKGFLHIAEIDSSD